MDAITLPSAVPDDIKAVSLFVRKARELKSHDPVMAYWCCFWAVELGVANENRSKEGTGVLMQLLDALEQMRALLADNDAVTNKVAGQAYVENFALQVFNRADDEDRAGRATKATVQTFLAAATFIEVIKSFTEGGVLDAEFEAKHKYARFKAASLSKAFKAGVAPTPGSTVSSPTPAASAAHADREEQHLGQTSVDEERAVERALFPSTPSKFPKQTEENDDEKQATTPPAAAADDIDASLPSFPATPTKTGVNDDDDEAEPSAPPLPSPPLPIQPLPSVSSPDRPMHINLAPLPPSDLEPPPQPPSFPLASPSAPPAAPAPAPAPPVRAPAPSFRAPAPAPPVPEPTRVYNEDETFDLKAIQQIQKHAKWAVSALDYEDFETARRELREALRLLG